MCTQKTKVTKKSKDKCQESKRLVLATRQRQNTLDILGNMDEEMVKERACFLEMMADACDNKHEGAGVNSSETSAADSGAVEYKSGGGGGAGGAGGGGGADAAADDGCGGTASNANAVKVDSSGAECVGAGDGGGDVDSGGVYVSNLPFNATEDDVRGLFRPSATCGTSVLAADFQH